MKIYNKFTAKNRIERFEVNSGVFMLELEKCPSLSELLDNFKKGYPIQQNMKNLHSGLDYKDDDVENIPNVDYDPDISDVYKTAHDVENTILSRAKSAKVTKQKKVEDSEQPTD